MNAIKTLIFLWVVLFVLLSCEQEETLQGPIATSLDPNTDLTTSSSSQNRNFEVLDLSKIALDRNGYQRVRQNKATGSILYANIKNRKIIGYQILKSNSRKVKFVPLVYGIQCPNYYVCIHSVTGKYIFYDKCVTNNPCDRKPCPDLWWCIDPVTGNYLLYDKCKTDTSPCEKSTLPFFIVNKKYQVNQFCPSPEYTWMIDPETGNYMLYSKCDTPSQLFLEIGW